MEMYFALEENKGILWGYDLQSILYTKEPLKKLTSQFIFDRNEYQLNLKEIKKINFSEIIKNQAFQPLDIMFLKTPFQLNSKFVNFGNYYFNLESINNMDQNFGFFLGQRQTHWLTKQIGTVAIVDITNTILSKETPIIEWLKMFKVHPDDQPFRILKFLKGYKIFTKQSKKLYNVTGIPKTPYPNQCSFKMQDSNKYTTIEEYYWDTYKIKLNRNLPCLQCGHSIIPMELAFILSGQRKPITNYDLKKLPLYRPQQRFQLIKDVARNIPTKINNALEVSGKILNPPSLLFANKEIVKDQTNWKNFKGKFFLPKTLEFWTIVFVGIQSRDQEIIIKQKLNLMIDEFQKKGINVKKNPQICCDLNFNSFGKNMNDIKNLGDITIVVIPESSVPNYEIVKSYFDYNGLRSQVVTADNILKIGVNYFSLLSLKINAKLGGMNWILNDINPHFDHETMLVGFDVNHPEKDEKGCSVASMVAVSGPGKKYFLNFLVFLFRDFKFKKYFL